MEFAPLPMHSPQNLTIAVQKAVAPLPVRQTSHIEIALWLGVILVLFMAPVWIAPAHRRWSVGIVTVMLGWTGLGWLLALVMAVRARESAKGKE